MIKLKKGIFSFQLNLLTKNSKQMQTKNGHFISGDFFSISGRICSCARMQIAKTKKHNDKNHWTFKDSTLI
ncbi:MAG: hypothetical protein C0448_05020 [Sphingobacteriaceae bacterium]|nr:hypothetical protein [Sphingobacteriaceae bacterium]